MHGWLGAEVGLAGRFEGRKMGERGLENLPAHPFSCQKVRSGSLQIETAERAGGAAKLIGFDAEMLEHADVEIAERWRAVGIEGEVLSVTEAAAGKKGGQILGGVTAAIAEVAAEEDGGAVEQASAGVFGLTEFCQQATQGLERFGFDDLELRQFRGVFAMMRKVVVAESDAFDGWGEGVAGQHDGDEPGGVGLEGEVAEIKEQARASDEVGGVGDVRGRLGIDFGFGRACPALVIDHAHLQLADAGEVFVELFTVLMTDFGAEGTGLRLQVVEDAAPVIEALELGADAVAFAFEKEPGEDLGR